MYPLLMGSATTVTVRVGLGPMGQIDLSNWCKKLSTVKCLNLLMELYSEPRLRVVGPVERFVSLGGIVYGVANKLFR